MPITLPSIRTTSCFVSKLLFIEIKCSNIDLLD